MIYNAGEGGRIYTIPLLSSNGEKFTVKAIPVESILTEKIVREEIIYLRILLKKQKSLFQRNTLIC